MAIVLAVVTPTRRPVNNPGPTSTATAVTSFTEHWTWVQRKPMAGTKVSA